MAIEQVSFDELLEQAPMAPEATTVSVVGALSRTKEMGQFIITTMDGQQMTLKTDAVKSHTVLGGAVGQPIVRLELDPELLPKDLLESLNAGPAPQAAVVHSIPQLDHTGFFDTSGNYQDITGFVHDQTIAFYDHHSPMVAPFMMATPHQAAPDLIAALQALGTSATFAAFDRPKPPRADHTYHGSADI